jgi:hypothetical protein
MIDQEKLKEIIKSHIPNAPNNIIENISTDILQDAKSIIYSMVRQSVGQVREDLYSKNSQSR